MAAEKMPAGKTLKTITHTAGKGHAALAWHHFFRELSDEKISDDGSALPRAVQE